MIRFLIILLLICTPAYSGTYAVERSDGGVTIVSYLEGSNDTLSDVLEKLELTGRPVQRIDESDLPDIADREFWAFNDVPIGAKLKVDAAKKAAKQAEKAAKQAKKNAALSKIGLTEEELQDLLL